MSVRRDVTAWFLVVGVLAMVLLVIWSFVLPQLKERTTVRLGDGVFTVKVATTSAELSRGLSGAQGLAPNEGMLFVFRREAKWSIWMKDMKIPIDIIWLDKGKKVVYIVKNAQPDSYPQEKFAPKTDAQYVLELAAGTVDSRGIMINDEAKFELQQQNKWWQQ